MFLSGETLSDLMIGLNGPKNGPIIVDTAGIEGKANDNELLRTRRTDRDFLRV